MEKPFLNLKETSEYLGIGVNSLYQYIQKNQIPHYRPKGRKVYFKVEDLNEFILSDKSRIEKKGGEL